MGERIAALRKSIDWTDANGIHRQGMTQTELAERTGLQRSHIVRIEKGAYGVTIDVLSIIAEVNLLIISIDRRATGTKNNKHHGL